MNWVRMERTPRETKARGYTPDKSQRSRAGPPRQSQTSATAVAAPSPSLGHPAVSSGFHPLRRPSSALQSNGRTRAAARQETESTCSAPASRRLSGLRNQTAEPARSAQSAMRAREHEFRKV